MTNVQTEKELEFLKVMLEQADREAKHAWTRFYLFFVLNSAALGTITANLGKEKVPFLFLILLIIFCEITCYIWHSSHNLATRYKNRWWDDINKYATSREWMLKEIKSFGYERDGNWPKYGINAQLRFIIYGYGIVWGISFVFVLLKMI